MFIPGELGLNILFLFFILKRLYFTFSVCKLHCDWIDQECRVRQESLTGELDWIVVAKYQINFLIYPIFKTSPFRPILVASAVEATPTIRDPPLWNVYSVTEVSPINARTPAPIIT